METFNYLTLWIFSNVPQVLNLSSKLTRPERQRFLSLRLAIGSNVQSLLPMTPASVFCAITTPLEKDYNDFQNHVVSGLTTEQAVAKLRSDRIPPTGAKIYSYLQSVRVGNNMQYFSDSLKWYNKRADVPTLEAMLEMIEFYHNREMIR